MMFFGFAEVLALALLAGGMNNSDLVGVIQPRHYFEARQIRMSIDSMIDVALAEPKDGKKQIMQLCALRYLADESAAFKKASNYASNREAIELIATGQRAQDKAGFSREYAQRVLDKLDGKKPEKAKKTPPREDALAWFPDDATLVGILDLQAQAQTDPANDPIKALLKIMPEREKLRMYDAIEKCGNVRLDRISFAYGEGNGKRDGRVILRVTGKGSQEGLLNLFQLIDGRGGRLQSKEIKDDKGVPIMMLQEANNRSPIIMLVGNTDLVVVTAQDYMKPEKQDALAKAVLETRDKKKTSAAAGKLKDRLAKVPDKAVGLLIGDVPGELKQELMREVEAVPDRIQVYLERTDKGLDVQAEAGLENAEAAGKLVQRIGALRKMGIAELQKEMQRPMPAGAPPIPFQGMINLLESMQVQSLADKVNFRVVVPNGLIQQLPLMMMGGTVEFDGAIPVPPPELKR